MLTANEIDDEFRTKSTKPELQIFYSECDVSKKMF